jgi:hypothetical protein
MNMELNLRKEYLIKVPTRYMVFTAVAKDEAEARQMLTDFLTTFGQSQPGLEILGHAQRLDATLAEINLITTVN